MPTYVCSVQMEIERRTKTGNCNFYYQTPLRTQLARRSFSFRLLLRKRVLRSASLAAWRLPTTSGYAWICARDARKSSVNSSC